MTGLEQWDPSVATLTVEHREILSKAAAAIEAHELGLNQTEQLILRPVMRLDPEIWSRFADEVDDEVLVDWIKVLTLAEHVLSGFECNSKSPVIALFRNLKNRGPLPDGLTNWIRANTSNRFFTLWKFTRSALKSPCYSCWSKKISAVKTKTGTG